MLKYLCLVIAIFAGAVVLAEPPSPNLLLAVNDACQCQTTGVCDCEACECGTHPIALVDNKRGVQLDFADLRKLPKSLGYGSPEDRAPIPDSLGTLVALQSDAGNALIDEHHQVPPATRKIPAADSPYTPPSASPRTQYRREYIGTSCGPNGCTPQYRWVPVTVSYTPPAQEYPVYDSIGTPAQSYGSYGCAVQSSSGCSGSSAGYRVGPIRRLFGWRR